MTKETYDKFASKYAAEKFEISRQMENCSVSSSNHKTTIKTALDFACNLLKIWQMGSIGVKEKLQKLLFPEGLAYDKEIGAFRTNTVNSLIAVIARLSGDSLLVETQMAPKNGSQSRSAVREGFEPSVQCNPYASLANWSFRPLRHLTGFPFGKLANVCIFLI